MSQAGVYSSGGPTPPSSPPAFGQVYNQAAQVVNNNANWTFDSNGPLLNVSHTPGSDTITINSGGTYLVTWYTGTNDDYAQSQLLQNGVPVPQASTVLATGGAGTDIGFTNAIINFNSGDTVQIKNTSGIGVTISASPTYTNASITFEKIPSGGASSGLTTIVGNVGSATQSAGIINLLTANTTVLFEGSGNTLIQDFNLTSNLGLGSSFPSLTTGTSNVGVGRSALNSITQGNSNTAVGVSSQSSNTMGFFNTSIGRLSLQSMTIASFNTALGYNTLSTLTTSGDLNTAVGAGALNNITTGGSNIALGANAGSTLTSTESSNIYIGNSGVISENHTIRIGTDGSGVGQQNTTVIAGDVASVRSFTATNGNITAANGDVVITAGNLEIASATSASGSVGLISYTGAGSAFRFISARGTQNFFAGFQSGNTTLTTALAIGNTGIGFQCLESLTTGAANTVLGQSAGASITSGNHHTAIGLDALDSLPGGSDCVVVGDSSGTAYNTTETNNIILGANITGSTGETNTIRIGNTSNNRCFVNGIVGNTIVGPQTVVIDPTDGQLGTISGGGLTTWSVITANQTAVVNNGYFINKAGTLALALPATSAVGDTIKVININTGTGVQFTQAAGQQIFVSSASTTLGATGTLTSSVVGDTITLVCRTANTIWWAESFVGAWTTA